MSNGNPPTPQEMAELFNAMKEELQQLKKERAERNKREEGKPHKEAEDDDDDVVTSCVLKTRRSKALSKEIMDYEMPLNFTLPTTLKPYKGVGDPIIHVTKFESMMILNGAFDIIICRSFPTFLDGSAFLWFSSLPEGSIK
ncbi:hypothetical protein PIB30_012370 [Stylosanthes scabra]|uniref:Uncharacterized protein n=1 Tax=Stylosanthes scabra TaxID=79078 RepID=A0ABU6Z3S5_9FABA|nr:hypothetical protein [Stylosanthes scabra]